jgi:polysaccharide export outer membrane protein
MIMKILKLSVCVISLLSVSCTFLPSSGPSGYNIKKNSGKESKGISYEVIKVDSNLLSAINAHSNKANYLSARGRKSDTLFGARGIEAFGRGGISGIALGDVVSVAIYETDSSLFGPTLAAGAIAVNPVTTLPPQTIDQSGEISVPFLGRVQVLGRRLGDVEREIRDGLKMKTADPQVVVTIFERKGGDLVSVSGDVKAATRIPVALAGTRLVDAIASAGGSQSAPYDTMVTVTRGQEIRSDLLQEVYDIPNKNIYLQPGDSVVLRKRPLSYLAFGSTGRVGSYPLTVEDLNLSDAMALSGGANDFQANPSTIFLYREENNAVVAELGHSVSSGSTSPVIYQLDLHDPRGFFLANNFTVRDRDVIYYAPAGSAGVLKFMGLINTFIAPAVSGVGIAGSASTLGGNF